LYIIVGEQRGEEKRGEKEKRGERKEGREKRGEGEKRGGRKEGREKRGEGEKREKGGKIRRGERYSPFHS
jgi:hypothetical protein